MKYELVDWLCISLVTVRLYVQPLT